MLHVEVNRNIPTDEDIEKMPASYINPSACQHPFLDNYVCFDRVAVAMTSPEDEDLYLEYWSTSFNGSVPTFTPTGLGNIMKSIRARVEKYGRP